MRPATVIGLLLCVPLRVATGTILPNWGLSQLAARSDRVVLGEPGPPEFLVLEGRIHTRWPVRVIETLRGAPADTLDLYQLGGKSGTTQVEYVGTAQLEQGKRFLFFLHQDKAGRCFLVGMGLGALRLDKDKAVGDGSLSRMNGTVPAVSGPTSRVWPMDEVRRVVQGPAQP